MGLSVVYGRDVDGETTTFGTTGYTYDDTFVLYDRSTESLWYPMGDETMTAVSGPQRGRTIPFIHQPPVVTLGEWRALHPETLVLLGDRPDVARRKAPQDPPDAGDS